MAIALEFANVIIRKSALDRYYPGGIDALVRQSLPNFAEDAHLIRVGFMSTYDANRFLADLQSAGVQLDGAATVVTRDSESLVWLSVGWVSGRFACWQSDEPPGEVVESCTGFLLRCPRSLYARLQPLLAQQGIIVTPPRKGAVESSADAVLACVREDACIQLEVFGDIDSGEEVALWAQRDIRRRVRASDDLSLLHDIEQTVRSEGASEP